MARLQCLTIYHFKGRTGRQEGWQAGRKHAQVAGRHGRWQAQAVAGRQAFLFFLLWKMPLTIRQVPVPVPSCPIPERD